MKVKVLHNQSLFDIAIMYFGTANAVFEIALLNNISVTEVLHAGLELLLPNTDYGFNEVVNYYRSNRIAPATEIDFDFITENEGISYWAINVDFIVQ